MSQPQAQEKSGTRYHSSREAATCESPARQCREGKVEQAGVPSGTAPSRDTVSPAPHIRDYYQNSLGSRRGLMEGKENNIY